MKRGWSLLLLLAISAVLLSPEARACRYCRGGPEDDRFGVNDPYNAFQPNALVEAYRSDAPATAPKAEEIVTNAKDLAAAAAAAQLPGGPPAREGSALARLAKFSAASANPAPQPASFPASAPKPAVAPATARMELPRAEPLNPWASRFIDASILASVVGVGLFFSRRGRA